MFPYIDKMVTVLWQDDLERWRHCISNSVHRNITEYLLLRFLISCGIFYPTYLLGHAVRFSCFIRRAISGCEKRYKARKGEAQQTVCRVRFGRVDGQASTAMVHFSGRPPKRDRWRRPYMHSAISTEYIATITSEVHARIRPYTFYQ